MTLRLVATVFHSYSLKCLYVELSQLLVYTLSASFVWHSTLNLFWQPCEAEQFHALGAKLFDRNCTINYFSLTIRIILSPNAWYMQRKNHFFRDKVWKKKCSAGFMRPCRSEISAFRQSMATLRCIHLTCVPSESIRNKRKCNKKVFRLMYVFHSLVLGEKCGFMNII